jgi:hypothetical protein
MGGLPWPPDLQGGPGGDRRTNNGGRVWAERRAAVAPVGMVENANWTRLVEGMTDQ